ncbi:MAG: oligosaccharide flippase family protein [Pelagibacterales bacterium]|nr:oligosaccharide flippase family protein [Pelagibacterales bacterium]
MINIVSKSIDGGKWQSISVLLCAVIQYSAIIIISNNILPSEYGIVILSFSIIEFSFLFINAGLGSALIQKDKIDLSQIRSAYTITILFAIICYLLLITISSTIAQFFNDELLIDVLYLLGIIFIFRAFSSVPKSLLHRDLEYKKLMIIDILSFFIGYFIVGIPLVYNGFSYWSIIYAALVQALILGILSFIYRPHNIIPFISIRSVKKILNFGMGLTISRFFNFFGKEGDKFVVGRLFDSGLLGIYGMAAKLIMLPVKILGNIIDHVLFPILSRINNERKIYIYLRVINYVSLALIVGLIVLSSFLEELVMLTLGDSWLGILVPLYVMLIACIFKIIIRICDVFVRAIGAVYKGANQKIIMTLLIFCFSYIGSYWGIVGVAVGVNLAVFITMIKMLNLCSELMGLDKSPLSFKKIIPFSILGLSMSLITFTLKPFLLQGIDNLLLVVSIIVLINIGLISFIMHLAYPSLFRKIYVMMFRELKFNN